MNQESTEELTTTIIKNSKEITKLLNKDRIEIREVDNYHLYPIADNDTPKLSSDRLEYSLSNGYLIYNLTNLEDIKRIYDDITIEQNENNEIELGFNTKEIAENFVELTSKLSIIYREDRTRYSMQFIADILKRLNEEGKISKEDLYRLTEEDIIKIIKKSKYADMFNEWTKSKEILTSTDKPHDLYSINHGAKIRYIDSPPSKWKKNFTNK